VEYAVDEGLINRNPARAENRRKAVAGFEGSVMNERTEHSKAEPVHRRLMKDFVGRSFRTIDFMVRPA